MRRAIITIGVAVPSTFRTSASRQKMLKSGLYLV